MEIGFCDEKRQIQEAIEVMGNRVCKWEIVLRKEASVEL